MHTAHFTNHRDAALALLNLGGRLTRKKGQFLGQLCVDPTGLSEKQHNWLSGMLKDEGLPPLVN